MARLKHGSSDAQYHCHIKTLVALFAKSFLKPNVMKTKEVCFGSGKVVPHPVKIKDHMVEMAPNFGYLGIVLDSNLTFNGHVDHVYRKGVQRMFLPGKLRGFSVKSDVFETVYKPFFERVITFNTMSWYGRLTVKDRAKLTKL